MPRSSNQKQKLLHIMKLLTQRTDEAHPVTMTEILEYLSTHNISAERKSVYDDLAILQEFGLDVMKGPGGYYLASREFELPELKLLVDSVQSSKFITEKKTLALIRKIEGLGSIHDAKLLQRQVYVLGRVKSMNESVYYHVDELSGAIAADRTVRFRYFEYTPDKERRYRHNGAWYEVSPFALMWDDENYYLLAWDEASADFRHYRVDKMVSIAQTDRPRSGKEAFAKLDMSVYSQRVFGMFGGREETVRLRFANRLAGAVIDRFGRSIILVPDGPGHFVITVPAVVSPQFFAWVFGFGADAELLSPASARAAFAETLAQVQLLYR